MIQLPNVLNFFDSLVILLSREYVVLDINQAALDFYGWKKSDVLNQEFSGLVTKRKLNPLRHSVSSHQSISLRDIITVLKKKNKQTIISWDINSIPGAKGKSKGLILIGKDVSLQKKLEERNYELDSIIAQMPGNVYWYDKDHKYLGCNENSAKTLAMSRQETIGYDFVDLMRKIKDVPEAYINKWVKDGEDVMRTRKPKLNILEVPFVGPDNELIHTITNKVPLFDRQGKLSGVLGITTDISQQKKIEQDLKLAKDKAEMANRTKTEFLSNMSHDVKTPLAGMIAFSELLGLKVAPELKGLTQDLLNAGKRLMVFFENVIELSKLEGGSVKLVKENFNLKELLNEITLLFKPTILAKGLFLRVNYSAQLSQWIFSSRMMIYRIILNLLGNAVKFTDSGYITIDVDLNKSTSRKKMIDLTIADTGIGISRAKQIVIFEKFSRLNSSFKGVYEGHGIGLYIVQEFVKSLRGSIRVESKIGKGSRFIISLPLKVMQSTGDEVELEQILPEDISTRMEVEMLSNTAVTETITSAEGSYGKILFVEDNIMAQISGKNLFEHLGYQVDIAENGQKGLALFEPGKYSLIFIDVGLPDLKGYKVSKRFRKMEEPTGLHTPILGLSAHASLEEKQLSSQAGMEQMLSKPLLLNQAKDLLREYVKPTQLKPELATNKVQPTIFTAVGKTGLRIIDLEKLPDDLDKKNQTAWNLLAELMKYLLEARSKITTAYKAHNLSALKDEVHRLYGGLCYTSTPDFLQTAELFEANLHKGENDQLDALYKNLIEAMNTFEELYQSIRK